MYGVLFYSLNNLTSPKNTTHFLIYNYLQGGDNVKENKLFFEELEDVESLADAKDLGAAFGIGVLVGVIIYVGVAT